MNNFSLVQHSKMLGTPLMKVCVVGTRSDFVESLFWLHENEPYSLFFWRYARTNILFPFMYKLNHYRTHRENINS